MRTGTDIYNEIESHRLAISELEKEWTRIKKTCDHPKEFETIVIEHYIDGGLELDDTFERVHCAMCYSFRHNFTRKKNETLSMEF